MKFTDPEMLSQSLRSKIKIFQAFEQLAEFEEFDGITVKQICEAAHTSKTTFYKHFRDRYDIVQWLSDLFFYMGVGYIGRTLTWEQGHRISTTGYLHYHKLLSKAFQCTDYNGLASYSPRRREENLLETLSEHKRIEITSDIGAQVISLATGETAFFKQYLIEHDEVNVDEVVKAMMSIIPSQLHDLLEEPASPRKTSIEEDLMNVEFIIHMLSMPISE